MMLAFLGLALLLAAGFFRLVLARRARRTRSQACRTMVVLGSGGHTAEMLRLFKNFDPSYYTPRVYVTAQTDALSSQKAVAFESSWGLGQPCFRVESVPRSREVGQPWLSSAFTTLYAMFFAVALVFREQPDLVGGMEGLMWVRLC